MARHEILNPSSADGPIEPNRTNGVPTDGSPSEIGSDPARSCGGGEDPLEISESDPPRVSAFRAWATSVVLHTLLMLVLLLSPGVSDGPRGNGARGELTTTIEVAAADTDDASESTDAKLASFFRADTPSTESPSDFRKRPDFASRPDSDNQSGDSDKQSGDVESSPEKIQNSPPNAAASTDRAVGPQGEVASRLEDPAKTEDAGSSARATMARSERGAPERAVTSAANGNPSMSNASGQSSSGGSSWTVSQLEQTALETGPLAPGQSSTRGSAGEAPGSFFGLPAVGERIVYLVDRSGSMGGDRFELALRELERSVAGLAPDQTFQVFFFSDTSISLVTRKQGDPWSRPGTGDWDYLQSQIGAVEVGGGTDPRDALVDALRSNPDTLFLLSDGEFEDPVDYDVFKGRSVVDLMNESASSTRVHAIGLHEIDSLPTLRELASVSNGRYRFVPARVETMDLNSAREIIAQAKAAGKRPTEALWRARPAGMVYDEYQAFEGLILSLLQSRHTADFGPPVHHGEWLDAVDPKLVVDEMDWVRQSPLPDRIKRAVMPDLMQRHMEFQKRVSSADHLVSAFRKQLVRPQQSVYRDADVQTFAGLDTMAVQWLMRAEASDDPEIARKAIEVLNEFRTQRPSRYKLIRRRAERLDRAEKKIQMAIQTTIDQAKKPNRRFRFEEP